MAIVFVRPIDEAAGYVCDHCFCPRPARWQRDPRKPKDPYIADWFACTEHYHDLLHPGTTPETWHEIENHVIAESLGLV